MACSSAASGTDASCCGRCRCSVYDVPVLGPIFLEGEGAAAGFADFFLRGVGRSGLGLRLGHLLAKIVE